MFAHFIIWSGLTREIALAYPMKEGEELPIQRPNVQANRRAAPTPAKLKSHTGRPVERRVRRLLQMASSSIRPVASTMAISASAKWTNLVLPVLRLRGSRQQCRSVGGASTYTRRASYRSWRRSSVLDRDSSRHGETHIAAFLQSCPRLVTSESTSRHRERYPFFACSWCSGKRHVALVLL